MKAMKATLAALAFGMIAIPALAQNMSEPAAAPTPQPAKVVHKTTMTHTATKTTTGKTPVHHRKIVKHTTVKRTPAATTTTTTMNTQAN